METYKIILLVFLIVFSGLTQGQKEKLYFDFPESILRKWPRIFNPEVSFFNKYKQLEETYWFQDKNGQNFLINKVDKSKERFPGSTTFLVWLTDPWHFFKFIESSFICAAVALLLCQILKISFWPGLLVWASIKILHALAFSISYKLK
jgi:hypothetical protein